MKQMRKEVADLLRSNKEENARIRVEAVIREINLLQVPARLQFDIKGNSSGNPLTILCTQP